LSITLGHVLLKPQLQHLECRATTGLNTHTRAHTHSWSRKQRCLTGLQGTKVARERHTHRQSLGPRLNRRSPAVAQQATLRYKQLLIDVIGGGLDGRRAVNRRAVCVGPQGERGGERERQMTARREETRASTPTKKSAVCGYAHLAARRRSALTRGRRRRMGLDGFAHDMPSGNTAVGRNGGGAATRTRCDMCGCTTMHIHCRRVRVSSISSPHTFTRSHAHRKGVGVSRLGVQWR